MRKTELNRNFFLYGCKSKQEFDLVRDDREQFNHTVWRNVSAMACVYFLVLFATTFSVEVVRVNWALYAALSMTMLTSVILLCTVARPGSRLLLPVVYVIAGMLLGFGIMVGTAFSPEYLAVTFHVLLIALPLVIVDRPYRMGLMEFLMTAVFVLVSARLKSGETRQLDIYNGVMFGALGQFVCYYMAYTRMQQFLTAWKIRTASRIDDLTTLNNRKAYEQDLQRLNASETEGVIYFAFDVNGLKSTNDTLGHVAGDALLCEAAECIRSCFQAYGGVYRIGGDEYAAVVTADERMLHTLIEQFHTAIARSRNRNSSELSISMGYAAGREYPEASIWELAKIADWRMYEEKQQYYSVPGHNRRH